MAGKKRFRKQDQLVIIVDAMAREMATNFTDTKNCYIATAIKNQLSSVSKVSVGPWDAIINGVDYKILAENGSAFIVDEAVRQEKDLAIVLQKAVDNH